MVTLLKLSAKMKLLSPNATFRDSYKVSVMERGSGVTRRNGNEAKRLRLAQGASVCPYVPLICWLAGRPMWVGIHAF